MEAFIIDPARLISDIVEPKHLADLNKDLLMGTSGNLTNNPDGKELHGASFQYLKALHPDVNQQPVTDDETTLHKFCVKLETALRHEQKERYSLLGARKDYWNFISDSIPKDDGVKFVQAIPQVKTPQGKGRAFIRYSLVKGSLADAIQRCLVMRKYLSACYGSEAILCHPSLSTALVNKLYDLNDVEFDLPCAGHELDISWPAFSRRSFVDGQGSGRRSSISSLTSVDLRNERPDPLVGLSSEVAALKGIFVEDSSHRLADNTESGTTDASNSDSMSAEPPTITGMTLEISHLHQMILKWKADQEAQLTKTCNESKKVHDDKKFMSQEYELKIKQLNERYSNLMKGASEDAHNKVQELSAKLSAAEKALSEREAEIETLKQEVKLSLGSSHEAQRSAIELERQLTSSERKQTELSSEREQLKERLKHREEMTVELKTKLAELRKKSTKLESSEKESNEKVAELQGELKAKEVVLERVQESFEKLNGMVFGSFEELESELKTRLMDRERGLENQSAENRRLETNIVEVQQQNRDLTNQLADAKAKVKESEHSNNEMQRAVQYLQRQLSSQQQQQRTFLSELNEMLQLHEDQLGDHGDEENGYGDEQDGHVAKDFSKVILKQAKHLVTEMSTLRHQLHEKSVQKEQLEEHVAELQGNIDKKKLEIMNLHEDVDSSKRRIEFIDEEKGLLEMEKIETDNKIAELEKSEQSLKSDISLVVEEKCKALNELTLLKGRKEEEERLRLSAQDELAALKDQLEQTVKSKHKLETELASITGTLQIIDTEKEDLYGQMKTLEDKMSSCQDERIGLEHELDVARQQLETANEARIRAEQGQVKAQEQLESLRCMMDQEIAALKFQLSSETMKYETELKSLSDQIQEYSSVKERLTEQQELIVDLESRLKERNDTLQHDKHKYVSEIKHLRNEVQQFKSGFDENKLRIRALENELLLTSKQLEEERSRQRDLKKKVDESEQEKDLRSQEYESKIAQVKEDMEELKSRLVVVTREKSELWEKADAMEHEIKVKADDRWMDDSEASNCLECNAEFTFLLRKHHCRMCGRIFCHSCSDNWIQTPHSRKERRVCRQCFNSDKKLKVQHVGGPQGTEEDAKSDVSDQLSCRTGSILSYTGGLDVNDGPTSSQPGPSGSRTNNLDSLQFSSTPVKPIITATDEESGSDSETSHKKHQSTISLNSAKEDKKVAANSSAEQIDRHSPDEEEEQEEEGEEEEYELLDASSDDACEQPGAKVVVSEKDSREDLVIPLINEDPGKFWHVTLPPGKRHLFQVLVGTPRASFSWKFSTEKKSIRFGVAFKQSKTKKDNECETVVPLSQYNSHQNTIKGEIQDVDSGVYILVFDNTFSRFTSKRVFCMVKVTRKDDGEDDDSLT